MKKINDILEDLNTDINIKNIFKLKKVRVNKIGTDSTNDVANKLNKLDLRTRKYVSIHKTRNNNFDSVHKNKRKKDISLREKNTNNFKTLIKKRKKINKYIKKTKKINYSNNIGNKLNSLKNKKFLSNKYFKGIIIVIISILFLGILDKIIIENRINSGYKKLISTKNNSSNIEHIVKNVNDAKHDFITSDILFTPFALILPNNINIINGYSLIKGGKNLTVLFDKGIQIYLAIKTFIDNSGGIHNINITNLISNTKDDLIELNTILYSTIRYFENIDFSSNDELNNKLAFAKNNLLDVYKFLDIFNKDFDIFLNILGHNNEKKYLVLFQNNDEIRPTGGFIGSLAIITVKNGKVIDFKKDDVYAYEWEINKNYLEKIPAPDGLNEITKYFYLRDSNNSVSFEKSSNNIKFFLDKMNEDIDGIIYINQNTVLDFIKLFGSVEFSKLGEKITQENFSLVFSTLVEAKTFKVGTLGTPKQILFDFANEFLELLKNKKDYFSYLEIIVNNLKSRDLVIYSFNPEENNLLWKLGINGRINYSDTFDFIYPVYTSIAGNKSDRYIDIEYKKEIIKNNDCSIDTKFTINRTHHFTKQDEEKIKILLDNYEIKDKGFDEILRIQGKGGNKVFTKVLLPKNVIVKEKEGMKINNYTSATVLEFYIETRVLESTNYEIEYKIPNTECKEYDFKLYKQPGIKKYSLEVIQDSEKIKHKDINTDFIY